MNHLIYRFISFLVICSNVILFFTVIYIILDLLGLGQLIEHHPDNFFHSLWFNKISRAIYFSAITLLSVGYGDITPYGISRVIAVIEALFGYILPAVITVEYLRMFPQTIDSWLKIIRKK